MSNREQEVMEMNVAKDITYLIGNAVIKLNSV